MSKLIMFLVLLTYNSMAWANEVNTSLRKNGEGDWSVTYKSKEPVDQLVFKRSPDDSRGKRWLPISKGYKFDFDGGAERVFRMDGDAFAEVTFQLKPIYISLPKDYAPFSPFSDGGMLFHSGRFFACAETCLPDQNQWPITVQAAGADNIIVQGKIYTGEAEWVGSDSGSKVYIGSSTPQQDSNFVSVVDRNLPGELKDQISTQLPTLMSFFAQNMGSLGYRPAFFASYSSTDDGTYGSQGGVFPGQMFLHWYGEKAIKNINSEEIFWFFSHEVAHLYQREGGAISDPRDAWLHEGAAEFFAGKAIEAIHDSSEFFLGKLVLAEKSCISDLDKGLSYSDASRQNPTLYYSCGLLLMNAISEELDSDSEPSLFELWSSFNAQVLSGKPAASSTFFEVAKPYLSPDFCSSLDDFISKPEFDSLILFRRLARQ